jgi:very-short-patch-repair endonuclease/predicted transcriptional regulator of viral defense system
MHGMPRRDPTDVVPDICGERQSRLPDKAIAGLARRQHGVVARRQLVGLGLSLDAIDHRVARGRLLRLHRSVYAVGHRALRREARWMAAVLASGEGTVLSHRSAAALWRIREGDGASVEISGPRQRRPRPGIEAHHVRLGDDEVTVHDAIPVTTPARTLLDLAAVLDEHRLARAAERAEALRLTSPTSLAALVARYPRRMGTPNLKRLIEEHRIVPTTTANDLERRFLTFLEANELPRPLVNESLDPYTPDFRWTQQRLVVELDGSETHGTRDAFERDRARDRALLAAGWRVARVTKRQLDDAPHELAVELRAMLASIS